MNWRFTANLANAQKVTFRRVCFHQFEQHLAQQNDENNETRPRQVKVNKKTFVTFNPMNTQKRRTCESVRVCVCLLSVCVLVTWSETLTCKQNDNTNTFINTTTKYKSIIVERQLNNHLLKRVLIFVYNSFKISTKTTFSIFFFALHILYSFLFYAHTFCFISVARKVWDWYCALMYATSFVAWHAITK